MSDPRIEIFPGDITKLEVGAIVNAANDRLLPGGGVCGAIHRAAGPGLARECAGLGICPAGEARITGGYDLPAAHVIHAVGPVWHGAAMGTSRAPNGPASRRTSWSSCSRVGAKVTVTGRISPGVSAVLTP